MNTDKVTLGKCEWLFYRPARVPKWPHLEKCDQPAVKVVIVDDEEVQLCKEHAAKQQTD